ncbi:protein of unknown function [Plantibacter flavus]|uniref:Uncharacterized protein DUF4935 n=1 Tax=Plantibacter flavus TaxID=150123 RepID=A0A3N2BXS7_9MICO|nr:PIN domain-containing protein [Plantibacter flavus]ROR80047.1 uncharacterized protein DUF4935 [Plantibacter flavus]SMG29004.1 protein of unknown function [Plantibacter flavus]
MLVIVDANIIVNDPLLRQRKWRVAQDEIASHRLRLVLPEVALLEAIGGYRRERTEKARQVRSIIRKSTQRAKGAAEELLNVYRDEANAYESILRARLREVGIEVVDPSEHSHLELTERAVNRTPPFDDDGGGYRDTLIWLTALEQVGEPPFSDLILLSDDGVFTKQKSILAEELHAETGAELTVLRSIGSLAFPGEYESGDFDLSDLDLSTRQIIDRLTLDLAHKDITRWSPPGVDYAQVQIVGGVDLRFDTLEVKKRYGTTVYEIGVDAIADVDAEVLVIHDERGGETDFTQMSARWDLRVRWRGEVESETSGLSRQSELEVRGLDERQRPSPESS